MDRPALRMPLTVESRPTVAMGRTHTHTTIRERARATEEWLTGGNAGLSQGTRGGEVDESPAGPGRLTRDDPDHASRARPGSLLLAAAKASGTTGDGCGLLLRLRRWLVAHRPPFRLPGPDDPQRLCFRLGLLGRPRVRALGGYDH